MRRAHRTNRSPPRKWSNRLTRQPARQRWIRRLKTLDRVRAKMRQSREQKGARSKAQPPVVGRPVELSRPKRRAHSGIVKTYRTEIRPRHCRTPRNMDSGSANDLRTNCAPCRRTLAAPIIHNHHSKKPADCAAAISGKRQRRVIRLKARRVNCRASVSDASYLQLRRSGVSQKRPTTRRVCPLSSRAPFPRFRARVPLQAIAAAVRGAARNREGTSRNASGLTFWRAIPEKLLPPVPDSYELRGRWGRHKRQ